MQLHFDGSILQQLASDTSDTFNWKNAWPKQQWKWTSWLRKGGVTSNLQLLKDVNIKELKTTYSQITKWFIPAKFFNLIFLHWCKKKPIKYIFQFYQKIYVSFLLELVLPFYLTLFNVGYSLSIDHGLLSPIYQQKKTSFIVL